MDTNDLMTCFHFNKAGGGSFNSKDSNETLVQTSDLVTDDETHTVTLQRKSSFLFTLLKWQMKGE